MKKLSLFLLIVALLLTNFIGCSKNTDAAEDLSTSPVVSSIVDTANAEAIVITPTPSASPTAQLTPTSSAQLPNNLSIPVATITETLDIIRPNDFFDDAVFLGDSITVGLKSYVKNRRKSDSDFLGDATFLAETSYSLRAAQQDDGYYLHPEYKGLRRQPQKSLKSMNAEKVLIMMGVNDVETSESIILRNYSILIDTIRKAVPSIEIYIISIFPMSSTYEDEKRNNSKIHYLNTKLRRYAYRENIPFIDVTDSFKIKKEINSSLYSDDFVHINSKGYKIYTEQLIEAARLFSLPSGDLGKIVNVKNIANARKSPDTESEVIQEIPKGSLLEIVSFLEDWYEITYNGETMYVFKDLVEYSDGQGVLGQISNVDEDANVREIPSTGTPPLGSINKDEYITIIPDYYNQYWYRIYNNGQIGYIYKTLIN
jgi:lysophospholipase L1-like esterase